MKKLRIFSAILIIIILLSAITSCKQSEDSNTQDQDSPTTESKVASFTNAYKSEFYKLPTNFYPSWQNSYTSNIIHYDDGFIYMLGKDSATWQSAMLIYDIERQMSDVELLTPYNEQADIQHIAYCSDDSVVTVESLNNTVTLNKVSANGEKIFSVNVSDIYEFNNNTQTHKLLIDGEDIIYIVNDYYIAAVSSDGNVLYNISFNNYTYVDIGSLQDGNVYVRLHDSASYKTIYKYIDKNTKTFGSDVEMTTNLPMYSLKYIYSGSGYNMYYRDEDFLYGYDKETKELTELMNWVNSDLNVRDLCSVEIISPDFIITTIRDTIDSSYYICVLTKSPDPSTTTVQTITLAITNWNTYLLLPAVSAFNRSNDKYRVIIDNYYDEANYHTDITRLNNNIASGNIPDMIFTDNSLPIRSYIDKGLFVDLYEYIDNDYDISRSDFIEPVLTSFETNGKLYELMFQFSLNTLCGKTSNIGDITGWTYEEFKEIQDSLPEDTIMHPALPRSDLLYTFTQLDLNKFVDYENGTCNFDSQEFIDAIKIISAFDEETATTNMDNQEYQEYYYNLYNLYKANEVYLNDTYLPSVQSIIQALARFDFEDVSIPGFPTISGKYGTVINNYSLAITQQSNVKEGAWEFIKYVLSDEIQSSYGVNRFFSVMKSGLQSQYEYIYNAFTDINYNYYVNSYGIIEGVGQSLSDDDMMRKGYTKLEIPDDLFDRILNLLESIEVKYTRDSTLKDIVFEEIDLFFNGEKTIEEAAKIIQNRAANYMSEIN